MQCIKHVVTSLIKKAHLRVLCKVNLVGMNHRGKGDPKHSRPLCITSVTSLTNIPKCLESESYELTFPAQLALTVFIYKYVGREFKKPSLQCNHKKTCL